jgi:uncharacterized protein YndB with AHSA1/START domain
MSAIAESAVRREVTVAVPPERAFEVFTGGMGTWWPLETHHIGEQVPVDVVIEPHVGGRCFERAADGTECDWGRVLAWEPPGRLVFARHLTSEWAFDPDPENATHVEVRFTPDGDGTRVELEHRHLERYADKAAEMHEALGSDGGWTGLLRLYKERAED